MTAFLPRDYDGRDEELLRRAVYTVLVAELCEHGVSPLWAVELADQFSRAASEHPEVKALELAREILRHEASHPRDQPPTPLLPPADQHDAVAAFMVRVMRQVLLSFS